MPKIKVLLLVPLLTLFLNGPVHAAEGGSSSKAASLAVRPAASDAQLEAALRTKLSKSKIGKDGFRFQVQRGIVTWEGTTAVPQHKGAATRMAHSSGATQVVNNIKVSNGGKESNLKKAYVER
jgi:hypothetical protein